MHVPIGRYHLKESFAPVLQSIFDKYGDIGGRYRRKLLFGINSYASYITSISCVLWSKSFNQPQQSPNRWNFLESWSFDKLCIGEKKKINNHENFINVIPFQFTLYYILFYFRSLLDTGLVEIYFVEGEYWRWKLYSTEKVITRLNFDGSFRHQHVCFFFFLLQIWILIFSASIGKNITFWRLSHAFTQPGSVR